MIWLRHLLVGMMAVVMAGVILCILAVGVIYYMMQRGPVELPQLRSFVENQLNEQLESETFSIGGLSIYARESGIGNRVHLTNVTLRGSEGQLLLQVPQIGTNISLLSVLKGSVAPTEVEVIGTKINLARQRDGSFDVLRQSEAGETVLEGDILALIDQYLARDELGKLETIALRDTEVAIQDFRTGRRWEFTKSLLTLTREGKHLSLRSTVDMVLQSGETTGFVANAKHETGSSDLEVSIQVTNATPTDLADMVGALDWLRALDSQVSASLSARLTGTGEVRELSGVLDLGQGRIKETPASQPIGFNHAKAYFEYDQSSDTLDFTQLQIDTTSGALTSEGYARLERSESGAVTSMFGQLRLNDININRPELFVAPLHLDSASVDLRVSFAPLTVRVGSITALDGDTVYKIKGRSVAGQDFWQNSYDIDVNQIDRDRVLDFWPKVAIPKTRKWMVENFHKGQISNFRGGLRSNLGQFHFAFNLDVSDARVRFLKSMPDLQQASGFAYLTDSDLRVDLLRGHLIAADNTKVDVAGSSFFIPDIKVRPAIGKIGLRATSGLQAALHLLDVKKFQFLKKVGLLPSVASGSVDAQGELSVPLEKKAKLDEVKFTARAEVTELQSDTLVSGKELRSKKMQLRTTDAGLNLSGPVTLDGVPMLATWTMRFGAEAAKGSRIVAQVGLSDANLRGLGIHLPKGSVKGEANATVNVEIRKGEAPDYIVESDLVGATLRVPALQWSKSAKTPGTLKMTGRFSSPLSMDSLSLTTPGLAASGKIDFNSDGSMQALRLSDLRAGRWLDSAATIIPQANGSARISLNGGAVDLRSYNIAAESSGSTSTSNSTIDVNLDRLTIITGLALTNFTAKLQPKRGLWGSFTGRVNGATQIAGQLFPQKYGTAFEINASDAGRVLASADLLENIYGGQMRVVIVPRQGEGHYDGTLSISQTRMRGASAMAKLLNAISVVGLIQQLNGEGIYFNTVEGQFLMRPNGVQLKNISAVGPSMGLTLDGWYNSAKKTVDFEGVTSPIYLLNGVFERVLGPLFGRRKGEGLFSFTYRMKGPAENPSVVVNPLSILTPGAFREIFRQEVPVPIDSGNAQVSAETSTKTPDVAAPKTEAKKRKPKKPKASDLR
ncbi:MAG: hypothetical protein GY952_16880 [Rhodobacteraceae bacterium]|nr:hypothetical protein [Paracoccaceae bacterium]